MTSVAVMLLIVWFGLGHATTTNPVIIEIGATSCAACGPGTFSGSSASLVCMACLPGYYSNSSRSSTCMPCPAGTYSDTYGSTRCTECPWGTVSIVEAAPSIVACVPCSSEYAENPMCSRIFRLQREFCLFYLVVFFFCRTQVRSS